MSREWHIRFKKEIREKSRLSARRRRRSCVWKVSLPHFLDMFLLKWEEGVFNESLLALSCCCVLFWNKVLITLLRVTFPSCDALSLTTGIEDKTWKEGWQNNEEGKQRERERETLDTLISEITDSLNPSSFLFLSSFLSRNQLRDKSIFLLKQQLDNTFKSDLTNKNSTSKTGH